VQSQLLRQRKTITRIGAAVPHHSWLPANLYLQSLLTLNRGLWLYERLPRSRFQQQRESSLGHINETFSDEFQPNSQSHASPHGVPPEKKGQRFLSAALCKARQASARSCTRCYEVIADRRPDARLGAQECFGSRSREKWLSAPEAPCVPLATARVSALAGLNQDPLYDASSRL
jgi:hypothetical protein